MSTEKGSKTPSNALARLANRHFDELDETGAHPDKDAGKRIHALRLELGLSQRDVARDLSKVSYAYLSRIEHGARTPSWSALIQIAERLKTTALYLATGQHDRCPVCKR